MSGVPRAALRRVGREIDDEGRMQMTPPAGVSSQ
mgnify:CR=1 FL=1